MSGTFLMEQKTQAH